MDFAEVVGELERDLLDQAMRRAGGNKTIAADLLRLKRTTLASKLKCFAPPGTEPCPLTQRASPVHNRPLSQ